MSRQSEIRERLEKATPGPWEREIATEFDNLYVKEARGNRGRVCRIWDGRTCEEANASFIAAAPDDVRYLLDRLEAAEGMISNSFFKRNCASCDSLPGDELCERCASMQQFLKESQ